MKYNELTESARLIWDSRGGEELFYRESASDACYQRFAKSIAGNGALDYWKVVFPDYYGGSFVNRLGELVVYMTDIGDSSKQDVFNRMESRDIKVVRVNNSFNRLVQMQKNIHDFRSSRNNADNPVAQNIAGCEIRDAENCLYVILNQSGSGEQEAFLQEVLDDGSIKFIQKVCDPMDFLGVNCGSGVPHGSSMGYRARKDGYDGFVTTAHGVPNTIGTNVTSDGSTVMGTVQAWNYEMGADAAFIRTNSSFSPTNTINNGSTNVGTLGLSLWEPVAGLEVSAIGAATSSVRTGVIYSTSYVYYDINNIAWVLVSCDVYGQNGDSGSLVYRVINGENYAAGIYKGVAPSGRYVFSKASTINSLFSLSRY